MGYIRILYRIAPNFFHKIAKEFRDCYGFLRAAARAMTFHIVARPRIFTRGVGACIKCEDKRIEIMLSRSEF